MKNQTLNRILSYAKPYSFYLIMALLSAILCVGGTLLAPIIIGKAIDLIIGPNNVDFSRILKMILFLGIDILVVIIFQWLMILCTNILSHKTIKDIRDDLFIHLQDIPLSYIDSTRHGDIMNRMINDVEAISTGLISGFQQLFSGVITILGTLGFMVYMNASIAIIVIILTPLSLFFASFIAKGCHRLFKKQSEIKGELSGYIEEVISNEDIIRNFNYQNRAQIKFEEINSRLHSVGVRAQFFSALTNPTTRFVNALVYAAVGVIGAITVLNGGLTINGITLISGALTIGELSCFLSYANQYTKPFNEISGVVTELQSAFASASRVFMVIDTPCEKAILDEIKMDSAIGNVDINHVFFSYLPDRPLIEDFNLHVEKGKRVAIVGPTGCGKTTLINLLMRFYDVKSGEILIDGNNINRINRNDLRNLYGMVLQETWMFEGTVFENIAYGKKDATREEVIEAAKKSHAHSFIKKLPNGYDTLLVGDGGLSQGQKQLLSIARVMINVPPMLILDEATSSIDTRTEIKIQNAFQLMMKGKTSFIIAHRLSTIKDADIIIVMRDGHIIETGNHDDLLLKKGFYAELYNSQFN